MTLRLSRSLKSRIAMNPRSTKQAKPAAVCLGVFAWNEEKAIGPMLQSLLGQSLFARLAARGQSAEIICVLNGCTDRTEVVANQTIECLNQQQPEDSRWNAFTFRVANLSERGKINAWNRFVHSLSAAEAQVLFLMDADILIHLPDTLWNMLCLLETDLEANIAVDRPRKDLAFKAQKTLRQRLSLASSDITEAAEAQLCAQLYAIRAEAARNIWLPKDLSACEDGFIKALVCTDALTHEVWPHRIKIARHAEHTFEAYTSPMAILRNQKRQIIGQTIVHILVDKTLKGLPISERRCVGEAIRRREEADPDWLKRLIQEHLKGLKFFWRLYPGLLTQRLRQFSRVRGLKRAICLPAALMGFILALVSSWRAFRALRSGCTNYWPKAHRLGMEPSQTQAVAAP